MKKYLKHFWVLYIIWAIIMITYIAVMLVHAYGLRTERTNTETTETQRVFDYADKLTTAEEASLTSLIEKREIQTGCDIVLVTLDEEIPSDLPSYAESWYLERKFGYNIPGGDGAIYMDNWQSGDTRLQLFGSAYYHYDQEMADHLVEQVCNITNETPYKAYRRYVEMFYHDMRGNGLFNVSIPKIPAVVAMLIATVIYLGIFLRNSIGKRTTIATTYVENGQPTFVKKGDNFISKSVSSYTRSSGSGGSGGGGGGGGGGCSGSSGHH